MSRTLLRRAGITLATGALAVTGVLTSAPTASAAPADDAAGWLAGQFQGGLMVNDQFDFDDYGLTADTVVALQEVGGRAKKINQARRALAENVNRWTSPGRSTVGGSVAKALVVAEVAVRADPTDFGGVDLVERMERVTTDAGPAAGRVQNRRAGFDPNTVAQAFAVQGLSVAESLEAPAATSFLLQQQCAEGYFRLAFSAADAPTQTCDADGSAPDFDATALAVINLQAVPTPTPAVTAAVDSALDWMLLQQRANGSFGGGAGTEAPNSNSTGLAAWALGQDERCRDASSAATWVSGLRLDNGAIAYDRKSLRTAKAKGITEGSRDQFRRATSQAAPGLEYLRVKACRA